MFYKKYKTLRFKMNDFRILIRFAINYMETYIQSVLSILKPAYITHLFSKQTWKLFYGLLYVKKEVKMFSKLDIWSYCLIFIRTQNFPGCILQYPMKLSSTFSLLKSTV